jgi:hypothetical protein
VGSFGSVSVTSTGTGGIYIAGANDSVALDLRGISSAYVQPAQPSTAITGTAGGINTVQARAKPVVVRRPWVVGRVGGRPPSLKQCRWLLV